MKRKQIIPALVIFCMVVSQAFGQLKTNEVGQRTFAYEDNSRNRKLTTEVWYPTLEKASPEDASPFIRISTKRDAANFSGYFSVNTVLSRYGWGPPYRRMVLRRISVQGIYCGGCRPFRKYIRQSYSHRIHKILGASAGYSFCIGPIAGCPRYLITRGPEQDWSGWFFAWWIHGYCTGRRENGFSSY